MKRLLCLCVVAATAMLTVGMLGTGTALALYANWRQPPVCIHHASNAPDGSAWRSNGYVFYRTDPANSTRWEILQVHWLDEIGDMYCSDYAFAHIFKLSTNLTDWVSAPNANGDPAQKTWGAMSHPGGAGQEWNWSPSVKISSPKYRIKNGVKVRATRLWYYQDLRSIFGRTTWDGYFGGDGHLVYLPAG